MYTDNYAIQYFAKEYENTKNVLCFCFKEITYSHARCHTQEMLKSVTDFP